MTTIKYSKDGIIKIWEPNTSEKLSPTGECRKIYLSTGSTLVLYGTTVFELIDDNWIKSTRKFTDEPEVQSAVPVVPETVHPAPRIDVVEAIKQDPTTFAKLQVEVNKGNREYAKKEREENKAQRESSRKLAVKNVERDSSIEQKWAYINGRWIKKVRNHWMETFNIEKAVVEDIRKHGYIGEFRGGNEDVWADDNILCRAPDSYDATEIDWVLSELRTSCEIEQIWDAAWHPEGFMTFNGLRVLNRKDFKVCSYSPRAEKPLVWQIYDNALLPDGQCEHFEAVIREQRKRAKLGISADNMWQPIGICMIGQDRTGKGLKIASIAKGFSVNGSPSEPAPAGRYLDGDTKGTSFKLQAPVVEFSDIDANPRNVKSIQTLLLNIISNIPKSVRPFYSQEKDIPLAPLVFYSGNLDKETACLPFMDLPASIRGKWCVFKTGNGMRAIIDQGYTKKDLLDALPEYYGWLDNSVTNPKYLKDIHSDGITGEAENLVGRYFNPDLDSEWAPLGDLEPLYQAILEVIAEGEINYGQELKVKDIHNALMSIHEPHDINKSPWDKLGLKQLGADLNALRAKIPAKLIRRQTRGDRLAYAYVFMGTPHPAKMPAGRDPY